MKRRGASLVFEQVMIFMIAVIIFLVCFSMFKSYESYYSKSIANEQIIEVSDHIISTILTLSRSGNINTTMKVTVPARIGNEYYLINLTRSGLNITTISTGINSFTTLSRINTTFSLNGAFVTTHGSEFMIYKRGNQIIIG